MMSSEKQRSQWREKKPQLLPVAVPWQVSSSAPYLRLMAFESGADEATSVTFVAYFGLAPGAGGASRGTEKGDIRIVRAPPAFEPGDGQEALYRLVRVTFTNAIEARMRASHCDTEVIEEEAYDWSQVPVEVRPEEDPGAYLRRFWAVWRSTSLCPDPGMYEVLGSRWLGCLGLAGHPEWKHFVILGHDAYVEVIAESWDWQGGQALFDW